MKKTFFLIIFTLTLGFSYAQDLIVKKDSSIIEAKIKEVGRKSILYKKSNYTEGPVFQIPKRQIIRIEYANGDTTVFRQKTVLSDRKGLYIGLQNTPGLSTNLQEGSDPLYTNNTGLNIRYHFNNNWGIKTGVLYQFSIQDNENNSYLYADDSYDGNEDYYISSLGLPLHVLYTRGKRLCLNIEAGGSYYYTLESPLNTATNFSDNYIFTAETILGASYWFSSKLSIDAGLMIQYDLANYTGQKNKNNLFSGLQFGLNYKIGK